MPARKLISELKHEAISTRKMLERLPVEKADWKPHEKSMSLATLALHIADIPSFVSLIVGRDELDFTSGDYAVSLVSDFDKAVQIFDERLENAVADLEKIQDEEFLKQDWTLRSGDHVIFTLPRLVALRTLAFSHLIHHRGQLSVYLRLLDIPVPGIYGPSADEA